MKDVEKVWEHAGKTGSPLTCHLAIARADKLRGMLRGNARQRQGGIFDMPSVKEANSAGAKARAAD